MWWRMAASRCFRNSTGYINCNVQYNCPILFLLHLVAMEKVQRHILAMKSEWSLSFINWRHKSHVAFSHGTKRSILVKGIHSVNFFGPFTLITQWFACLGLALNRKETIRCQFALSQSYLAASSWRGCCLILADFLQGCLLSCTTRVH